MSLRATLPVLAALLLLLASGVVARAAGPSRGVTFRDGWIEVGAPGEHGVRRAVLRNPGAKTVSLTLADGHPTYTFLSRTGGDWRVAGPIYDCGVGMTERELAPGDSIVFRVWRELGPGDHRYRVAIQVRNSTAFYASSSTIDFRAP